MVSYKTNRANPSRHVPSARIGMAYTLNTVGRGGARPGAARLGANLLED